MSMDIIQCTLYIYNAYVIRYVCIRRYTIPYIVDRPIIYYTLPGYMIREILILMCTILPTSGGRCVNAYHRSVGGNYVDE